MLEPWAEISERLRRNRHKFKLSNYSLFDLMLVSQFVIES
jgi:hypothetical protein